MKEHPILFSAPMVRAILSGQKTQTRRVMKQRYTADRWTVWPHPGGGFMAVDCPDAEQSMFPIIDPCGFACPYGVPGYRLWVRETWGEIRWATIIGNPAPPRTEVVYRAGPHPFDRDVPHGWNAENRWKPSIHMPRRYSRLTLEITGVRVEPLQKITDADCYAEGIENMGDGCGSIVRSASLKTYSTARACYALLWNDINAKRCLGWETNPWVWALTFERAK